MTDKDKNDDISFEELLEESPITTGRLKPGERVDARIVDITDDWVFLDLGGKSEGALDRKELLDDEGNLSVKTGDTISAYFLSSRNNEMLFTTRITSGEAGRNFLEHAWSNQIPVEGLVEKEIKGGFQVRIAGNTRAFCPFSQMGLQRVDDSSQYVGLRMSFLISEYGEEGRNVIISNRAILEAERRAKVEVLKEELREGMKVKGTVVSIRNFGAFVDIGGIHGLIPISEIGWARIDDINEVLSTGTEVEAVIMSLDWENDRISLSLKAAMPDPWDGVNTKYPQGSTHTGRVARLAKFGAFVTLEDGVDGLVHISKLGGGKRINHPGEVVEAGQSMEVTVESVDIDNKRISLTPAVAGRGDGADRSVDEDDFRSYLETTPSSMGTLGDLLKDKMARKEKKRTKRR